MNKIIIMKKRYLTVDLSRYITAEIIQCNIIAQGRLHLPSYLQIQYHPILTVPFCKIRSAIQFL